MLADVHANLPALEAVVEDMKDQGADTIWHLGDAVGYGAEPFACLQLLADMDAVLIAGNHEQAACNLSEANGFNAAAANAIRWTHDNLNHGTRKDLCELPVNATPMPGVFLFHGLPGNAAGYLRTTETAELVFDHLSDRDPRIRLAFYGHTHRPNVFTHLPGRPIRSIETGSELITAPGRKYLINPGSVGQPRNGDPRAQYAIYDAGSGHVTFRRTSYDVAAAQNRILDARLPPSLAARLSQGL